MEKRAPVGLACVLEHSPDMWKQTSGVAQELMGTQDGRWFLLSMPRLIRTTGCWWRSRPWPHIALNSSKYRLWICVCALSGLYHCCRRKWAGARQIACSTFCVCCPAFFKSITILSQMFIYYINIQILFMLSEKWYHVHVASVNRAPVGAKQCQITQETVGLQIREEFLNSTYRLPLLMIFMCRSVTLLSISLFIDTVYSYVDSRELLLSD